MHPSFADRQKIAAGGHVQGVVACRDAGLGSFVSREVELPAFVRVLCLRGTPAGKLHRYTRHHF